MSALDPEECRLLAAELREMLAQSKPGGIEAWDSKLLAIAVQLEAAVGMAEDYRQLAAEVDSLAKLEIELDATRASLDASRANVEGVRSVVKDAYQAEMVARGAGAVGPQAKHIREFVDALAVRVAMKLAVPASSDSITP